MRVTIEEMTEALSRMSFLPGFERLTKPALGEYYRCLEGYWPHEVNYAVSQALDSGAEFFPPPGALKQAIEGRRSSLGHHTWAARLEWLKASEAHYQGKALPMPDAQALPEPKESRETQEEHAQAFFQANPRLRVAMGPKPKRRAYRAPEGEGQ